MIWHDKSVWYNRMIVYDVIWYDINNIIDKDDVEY